jgi:hypothetical protein
MSDTPKKFPSEQLVPSGGQIYCHVFENASAGLPRQLFWSVTIDFKPIQYGEDEFRCLLTCEWIAWPLRDWRELNGQQLEVNDGDNGIESSFYMTEHDPAVNTKLAFRHQRDNLFKVNVDMLVDFHGYYGGDENSAMPIHAEIDVPFIGLLVVPGSLFPKPGNAAELRTVAAEFVDLAVYDGPEPWKKHGFVFRPAGVKRGSDSEE